MKKSYIIKNDSSIIESLSKNFLNYLPEKNGYSKLTTLGTIEQDYLYIVDFEKNLVKSFEKLFMENKSEEFIVDTTNFDSNELAMLNIAFEKSLYSFSMGCEVKENTSTISYTKNFDELDNTKIIAEAINNCKTLVNKPSNVLSTTTFTEFLEELAKESNLKFSVIDKAQLEKDGAGGILAVNKGSLEPARIVRLELKNSDKKPICLVGKGLIFDTGGYSLKPTVGIVNMKSDMGGGALVASVIGALGKLKANLNVIAYIPITDNLISEKAYRPDDVITFLNGKTTEIRSTDAEGRLILADALTYATKEEPELIIDAATLTGGVIAALGNKTTGVFGNIENEISNLVDTVNSLEEYAWHLPINDTHRDAIKGSVAMLKNSAAPGSASTAAAFLEHFVADNKWIHLDIAGTCCGDKGSATGAMVRPLIQYLLNKE